MAVVSTMPLAINEKKGRDEILEKCAKLMASKGYSGTSMRDLALTTGRSLSGLYHYFSNKEELLYLINLRGFIALNNNASLKIKDNEKPEDRLKKLIWNHVNYFYQHQNEMRVMMFGTHEMDKTRRDEISKMKHRYSDKYKKTIAEYIYKTSGIKLDKKHLDRRSYLLFGMMNWIYGWFSTDEHGSVEELVEDIFNTFTLGCSR